MSGGGSGLTAVSPSRLRSAMTLRVGAGGCLALFLRQFTARTVGIGPKAVGEVGGFGFQPRVSWLRAGRAFSRARIASSLAAAALLSLPSRSLTPPTRLETRTKESNTCASH